MCWTSRNELTKLIADKNIECYKNFRLNDIIFKQKSIFKFKFGKKKIIQLISLFKEYKYTPYKKNTTEYYHVSKIKRKNTKRGNTFSYSYTQDGKRKTISNVNIKKLEEEVKKRGLIWEKIS